MRVLDETVRRLAAYAAAGADCLYAPGIHGREEIRAVVEAASPPYPEINGLFPSGV